MNPRIKALITETFDAIPPTAKLEGEEIYFGPGKTIEVTFFTDRNRAFTAKLSFDDWRLEDSAKVHTEEEMRQDIADAITDLTVDRILLT